MGRDKLTAAFYRIELVAIAVRQSIGSTHFSPSFLGFRLPRPLVTSSLTGPFATGPKRGGTPPPADSVPNQRRAAPVPVGAWGARPLQQDKNPILNKAGEPREGLRQMSKPLKSHGAVFSDVPDDSGYYDGQEKYAIGPNGAPFTLYWRSRAKQPPDVWNPAPGEYQIRNPTSESMEVMLHYRESEPFGLHPQGTLRLTAESIAAYMAAPRI